MERAIRVLSPLGGLALAILLAAPAGAGEPSAAERGWQAMIGRTFSPPFCSAEAYPNAWKQWGIDEKPSSYDELFRERYGLHAAPYDNGGLPMGLRSAPLLGGILSKATQGITNDCLLCHAGSVAGRTVIGLGNASLDLQSLYTDLFAASGLPGPLPIRFSNVRGTVEAGPVVFYLLQFRDADLNLRAPVALPFENNVCEDVPPWWHLSKKKTMYRTGSTDVRAVRPLMAFMLSPMNTAQYIKRQEPFFADMQAYMRTLEPPRYPFSVDAARAQRGEAVFLENCARCHGTYGPEGTYPNKIVPQEVVGTDPALLEAYPSETAENYGKSWFAQETWPDSRSYRPGDPRGYQAPPLDGIWASAPYFHNGSVPTLYHVLRSTERPALYTRSFRTAEQDYDVVRVGWKITPLDRPPAPELPGSERRKVYDTSQPGRGNGGHAFGDRLTDDERWSVIEYLKTL